MGANVGIWLKDSLGSNFLAFLTLAIFYCFFHVPLLNAIPQDEKKDENKIEKL